MKNLMQQEQFSLRVTVLNYFLLVIMQFLTLQLPMRWKESIATDFKTFRQKMAG